MKREKYNSAPMCKTCILFSSLKLNSYPICPQCCILSTTCCNKGKPGSGQKIADVHSKKPKTPSHHLTYWFTMILLYHLRWQQMLLHMVWVLSFHMSCLIARAYSIHPCVLRPDILGYYRLSLSSRLLG